MDIDSFSGIIYEILIFQSRKGLADAIWKQLMEKGYECSCIKSRFYDPNHILSTFLDGIHVIRSNNKIELPNEIETAIKHNKPETFKTLILSLKIKFNIEDAFICAIKNNSDEIALFLFTMFAVTPTNIDYLNLVMFMKHASDMSAQLLKKTVALAKNSFNFSSITKLLIYTMPYEKLKTIENELNFAWNTFDYTFLHHAPEYFFRNFYEGERFMAIDRKKKHIDLENPKDDINDYIEDQYVYAPALFEFYCFNISIHNSACQTKTSGLNLFTNMLKGCFANDENFETFEFLIKTYYNDNSFLFENPLYIKYRKSIDEKLFDLFHLHQVEFINFDVLKFFDNFPKSAKDYFIPRLYKYISKRNIHFIYDMISGELTWDGKT